MSPLPKRVLITGGAGFVGQNLTPMLLQQGVGVVAVDKNEHNLRLLARLNPAVETCLADLSEAGAWRERLEGVDAVVDLKAQIASPDDARFEANNVRALEHVVEACRARAIRHLVHLSSSVALSVARDGYAESKRRGEEQVRASGLPHTILRPPLMFGCFDVKHLGHITRMLERLPVLPFPGSGRYLRQPLYVLDLCRIVLRCLERGPSLAIHNVIGHERIDFIDLVRAIAEERGLRRVLLPLPIPLFTGALRLQALVTRRPVFTADQLAALVAGDEFAVEDWPTAFGVPYTPFRAALREAFASPAYPHTREMIVPH